MCNDKNVLFHYYHDLNRRLRGVIQEFDENDTSHHSDCPSPSSDPEAAGYLLETLVKAVRPHSDLEGGYIFCMEVFFF